MLRIINGTYLSSLVPCVVMIPEKVLEWMQTRQKS
jgi:hypothetical protein